jgi:hypothetical protein
MATGDPARAGYDGVVKRGREASPERMREGRMIVALLRRGKVARAVKLAQGG